ncbi:MAG: exodeoxyribonuclease VII large subunit [Lachnospiraceae bacterium]|nr:exodeoxyribonuclease VII large subunit [Lachnospiraceae bacterium]
MQKVYSVSQINTYIRNMFTQDFVLNRVSIRGEVSNCKYHTSGHIYFSLKDASGTIACIMFAGARKGLAFRMSDGQQVVAEGSVNVYERDGKYQLYANRIRLDGAGLLYEKFLALKQELEEMGMFAPEYKKRIPPYVRRLGVVTAPTGAAVRDIINISTRRNPGIQLILYPAKVQGEGAAESVAEGLHRLDALNLDAIIVGRGGGSIEDLWAFNEETVARAIFSCKTPVISAVGHETDTTIADFVADLRAPTPSAAAELAVMDVQSVLLRLDDCGEQLERLMEFRIHEYRMKLEGYRMRLEYASPVQRIREQRQRAADAEEALRRETERILQDRRHRMSVYIERMKGLSPLEKLSQGYAAVTDPVGRRVYSVEQVKKDDALELFVSDGKITASVTEAEPLRLYDP